MRSLQQSLRSCTYDLWMNQMDIYQFYYAETSDTIFEMV